MLMLDLAEFLSTALEIKLGTVADRAKELRAAGLLSVGKQGTAGARMTDRDAINLLLANLIEHQRGDSVAENVKRACGLYHNDRPLIVPADFTRDLPFFRGVTAGEGLELLLEDFRAGRIEAWAAGEPYELKISFDARGDSVVFSLSKSKQETVRSALAGYTRRRPAKRRRFVDRQVTIDGKVFEDLAEALGPPD
jgi:hypothetical protein